MLYKLDYAVQENPLMDKDMRGGLDYIVLKDVDVDSIRIIGSVLGQSVALDHFESQVGRPFLFPFPFPFHNDLI